MNTKQTHKIRTATLSTFVAILACVSTTSARLCERDPRRRRGRRRNQQCCATPWWL